MNTISNYFFVLWKILYFLNFLKSSEIFQLDSTATLKFFGWTTASYSIGSTISTFFFGLWNQKMMSTKYPASFGNLLMALGNLLYGFLPTIGAKKWSMLLARFIIGLGSGKLAFIILLFGSSLSKFVK